MIDVHSWILSWGIRDHMRAAPSHPRGTVQSIDSGCRSIQPTDLPEAYRVPAELSEALHELGEKDTEAINKPLYGAAGYSVGLLRTAFPGSHPGKIPGVSKAAFSYAVL